VVVLVALALGAVSCGADPSVSSSGTDGSPDEHLTRVVSAFGVSAIVPDNWVVAPADEDAYAIGVSATPGPRVGPSMVPVAQGLLATRVDATAVGAPSDLYYLAAKGPIIAQARHDARCVVTDRHVYVNHAPSAITGQRTSPGDFVASATGRCHGPRAVTRFSYFVAAPGFGPARERGIPGSGLYLIMASTPAVPGASHTLAAMIGQVRFGADGAEDFVQAVRAAR
jgi:hypothetical protein